MMLYQFVTECKFLLNLKESYDMADNARFSSAKRDAGKSTRGDEQSKRPRHQDFTYRPPESSSRRLSPQEIASETQERNRILEQQSQEDANKWNSMTPAEQADYELWHDLKGGTRKVLREMADNVEDKDEKARILEALRKFQEEG